MPTRLATGHYRLDYQVPATGLLGMWRVHWDVVVDGDDIGFDETFEVILGSAVTLAPDWEAVMVAYLASRGELASVCTGGGTELPKVEDWPRWRLTRIGGLPDFPGWVQHPRFQVEAFGGTKAEANLLGRVLVAAVEDMPGYATDLGVITDSRIQVDNLWQPDPVTARPRYLIDFELTSHPPQQ